MVFVQWVMYLCFSVFIMCAGRMCVNVCVSWDWLISVCVRSVSLSTSWHRGLYLRSALGVWGLCNGMCWGSLVLRCFQNLMALVWMFRRRGYWANSSLHPLFGVFLWTLSILLQKSKWVSIGCFSQFKKSNFIEGPHTSLPYNALVQLLLLKFWARFGLGSQF